MGNKPLQVVDKERDLEHNQTLTKTLEQSNPIELWLGSIRFDSGSWHTFNSKW